MKPYTTKSIVRSAFKHVSALAVIAACTVLFSSIAPRFAGAATLSTTSAYCSGAPTTLFSSSADFAAVVKFLVCFLEQSIVPFLFALAIVIFFWGMVKFIANGGDAHEREQGQQFMIWGVVAIAVMFCVWGIVDILGQTFIGKNSNVIPQLNVN